MKHYFLFIVFFFMCYYATLKAQVGINTTSPDTSSILDITSIEKGVLIPRMTEAQRTSIVSPATGLLVYQTDNTDGFWYYEGTSWVNLSSDTTEFKSISGVVQNTTNIASDDFVFGSTSLENLAGTNDDFKIIYDKSKGAFRAGRGDTNWNDSARGIYSSGFGYNAIASGMSSFASGSSSYAIADYATAIGYQSYASGNYSLAIGNAPQAYGLGAISLGYNGVSSGTYSFGVGFQPYAIGNYTNALGRFARAGGEYASAIGYDVGAPSYGETALGYFNTTYTPASTTAANSADRLFTIGNGASTFSRSNALTLLKNGNLGLGIDTPIQKLDLVGASGNGMLIRSATTAANVSGQLWAGTTGFVIDSRLGNLTGGRNLHLRTGGVDRLFIENTSGEVGIGTTDPVSKLDIVGTAGQGMTIRSATTATNVAGFLWSGNGGFVIDSRRGDLTGERDIYFQTGGITRAFIERTTGEVGIGTTAPNYLLEVNGSAGKPGGGFWTATSDARLKKNVQDFKMGLQQLLQVTPVTYQYNDLSGFDTQKTYTGVIAQELQKVIPDMVGTFEKDGNHYLNVDGSAFTYLLINSVKELAQKKDDLEADVKKLKDRLSELEERLLLLESKK